MISKLLLMVAIVGWATGQSNITAYTFGGPLTRPFGLMRPMELLSPFSILQQQQEDMNRAFKHISPRYEITDTDDKFQLVIDVPEEIEASDITVSLEDENRVLSIKAEHEVNNEDGDKSKTEYHYKTSFLQSFTLDPAILVDEITANFKGKILTISAPKDLKKLNESSVKIPVVHEEKEKTPKTEEVKATKNPAEDLETVQT